MTTPPTPQTRAFPVGATNDMAAIGYVSFGKYPQLNVLQGQRSHENGTDPAHSMCFAGKKQLEDIRTAIDWLLEAAAPAPTPAAAPVEAPLTVQALSIGEVLEACDSSWAEVANVSEFLLRLADANLLVVKGGA